MASYTAIDNPELYFQVKTYTGNGTDDTSITLDGDENMQPDLVWLKRRDNAGRNRLFDSVRGATKWLRSDDTDAEGTAADSLKSFDSDGFTLGADSASGGINVNINTETMAAWCWKAGTSFSNDASATSVGSIDSAGSINTTAGFGIIEWSGSAANATIAHGLQAVPKMIICKDTNDTYNWGVYHHKNTSAPEEDYLYLNTNAATATSSSVWNDTTPISTVFSVGNAGATNASGTNNMIAYCFAEKQGFSKFGSYTGNGNADGTYVHLGFRPAYVLIKRSSATEYWGVLDNKRNTYNPANLYLAPNRSDADTTYTTLDFLSNGFKHRSTGAMFNASGSTYIYMAFAEAPFVNSKGVPCNAR